jgi:hypothetical protein
MFEAYGSGEWTMPMLAVELERRGLRIPATPKRPARPVSIQHIDKMLRNRYYIGYVTFEGVEYEGRHPALIDRATFERVQAVCKARRETREKTQKHPHYLKGSVFCDNVLADSASPTPETVEAPCTRTFSASTGCD